MSTSHKPSAIKLDSFSVLTLENAGDGKDNLNSRGFPSIWVLLQGHRSNDAEDRLAQFQTVMATAKQQALSFHSFLVEWCAVFVYTQVVLNLILSLMYIINN